MVAFSEVVYRAEAVYGVEAVSGGAQVVETLEVVVTGLETSEAGKTARES